MKRCLMATPWHDTLHPFAPPNQALHIFQNWSRIQTKRKRQHSGLNIAQQPGSVGIDVWGKASRMVLMYGASGQHTASCSVIDHVFFSPLGLLCCPSYFCSTCLYCSLLLPCPALLCPAMPCCLCCLLLQIRPRQIGPRSPISSWQIGNWVTENWAPAN